MRSIALMNQKGGVGKTTTAVNLAAGLAVHDQRVMLADLDPQGHATLHLGVDVSGDDATIYDVLVRAASVAEATQYVSQQISLLPAHIDLVGAEVELAPRENREHILATAATPFADAYDYFLIDCPPSLGLLTVNALTAVDEVIIPLQPHFFALQGLSKLFETVGLVRESLNPRLRVSGIVLCMHERHTRLAQEVYADVEQFVRAADPADPWHNATVFQTTIRRNIKLAECPSFGQTIFDYAPQSNGAEDYAALAREVLEMSRPDQPPKPHSAQADNVTDPHADPDHPPIADPAPQHHPHDAP